ncbi:MAG: glycosyltransferase [Kiritimatiellae bacterium]|nr:glycosyltransferase [Kiritimatiellia bacterium]
MHKVTVITPSFNSAKFIEICIKSIAIQRTETFKVRHIIMDGGSTDGTADVVKPYLNEDTEFISKSDKGPADAINHGIALSNSEYVCWLNADDVYEPGALERAVAMLDANPKASFCYGYCPIINENGNEIRKFITRFKELFFPIASLAIFQTLNFISQPSVLFRSSAVREIGELKFDLKAAWDYDFLLRIWKVGSPVRVKAIQAYFRWTPQSISGQNFEVQFKEAFSAAVNQAGYWKPWIWIHWISIRFIIILYLLMTFKHRKRMSKA